MQDLFTFSSVQLLSHVQLFVTPWTAAYQASLSITNSQSSPKPMYIESVIPFNHLILCHPLLLLPSIFPSIRIFSNESALHIRWPKYWSFSFNISPSNEHPGLISFRMDGLDLLAGTRKRIKPCFHLSDGVIYTDQRWGPTMWILLGGQWNRYRSAMGTFQVDSHQWCLQLYDLFFVFPKFLQWIWIVFVMRIYFHIKYKTSDYFLIKVKRQCHAHNYFLLNLCFFKQEI